MSTRDLMVHASPHGGSANAKRKGTTREHRSIALLEASGYRCTLLWQPLTDHGCHTLWGAITQKNEADHTVECDLWMESDEGERWVAGTTTVAVPARP